MTSDLVENQLPAIFLEAAYARFYWLGGTFDRVTVLENGVFTLFGALAPEDG